MDTKSKAKHSKAIKEWNKWKQCKINEESFNFKLKLKVVYQKGRAEGTERCVAKERRHVGSFSVKACRLHCPLNFKYFSFIKIKNKKSAFNLILNRERERPKGIVVLLIACGLLFHWERPKGRGLDSQLASSSRVVKSKSMWMAKKPYAFIALAKEYNGFHSFCFLLTSSAFKPVLLQICITYRPQQKVFYILYTF